MARLFLSRWFGDQSFIRRGRSGRVIGSRRDGWAVRFAVARLAIWWAIQQPGTARPFEEPKLLPNLFAALLSSIRSSDSRRLDTVPPPYLPAVALPVPCCRPNCPAPPPAADRPDIRPRANFISPRPPSSSPRRFSCPLFPFLALPAHARAAAHCSAWCLCPDEPGRCRRHSRPHRKLPGNGRALARPPRCLSAHAPWHPQSREPRRPSPQLRLEPPRSSLTPHLFQIQVLWLTTIPVPDDVQQSPPSRQFNQLPEIRFNPVPENKITPSALLRGVDVCKIRISFSTRLLIAPPASFEHLHRSPYHSSFHPSRRVDSDGRGGALRRRSFRLASADLKTCTGTYPHFYAKSATRPRLFTQENIHFHMVLNPSDPGPQLLDLFYNTVSRFFAPALRKLTLRLLYQP